MPASVKAFKGMPKWATRTTPYRVNGHAVGGGRRRTPSLWFAVPAIAIFFVFFLLPNVLNFVFPFTNWSAFHDRTDFVGMDNFRTILNDGTLLRTLRVTMLYALMVTIFFNAFSILLALLLERDTSLNRALRAIFFLPVVLSPLAAGYIFRAILSREGALNGVLSHALGHEVATAWLGSPDFTIVVVALIHTWKWMGLGMLIYLAGLKAIPEDVVEAATIDGAGRLQMFRYVRFPLLAPAVTFNVAMSVIETMNTFDMVQATTEGGPAQSTQVFNVYMFRTFGQGLFAQASAISLVLFLVVAVLAVPLVIALRRREQVL